MTSEVLKQKLRGLRALERRLRGVAAGGPTPVWKQFFAVEPGARVRYPFSILRAFDRESRQRAFREYLIALWSTGPVLDPADRELLELLGLSPGTAQEEVRTAFRAAARELHPDAGGDEELMRVLIDRYRNSSYG